MTDTSTPEFYGILTDAGEQLQFECLDIPDKTFEMLEMAVGDGNGSYYEPEKTQTKLKNECYRHAITRRMTDEENRVKSVILDIPEDITGFTIREVGVFGANGELLIIGKYPETPKRDTSSGAIAQLAIKVDLSQVNELILPILIDPSVNTASVEYVEKYFQKLEEKGQPNGYAALNKMGLVPIEQVPAYIRGCVNSGSVDENGEPDLMTYTESTRTVNVKSPFIYTTVSGKTYKCATDLSVVLDETLEGTVRIWIEKDDGGTFYLKPLANNIFEQKAEPQDAQENDIWIDTSIAPETQKIKTSAGWEIDEMVEIGSLCGLSGGGGSLINRKYNVLREFEHLETVKANVDLGNTIPAQSFKDMSVEWGMPDYSRMVDISSLSSYTCPSNGYVVLGCYVGALGYKSNIATVIYQVSTRDGYSQVSFYPVVQNETITRLLNTGTLSICKFIPMKGAEYNA